MNSVYESRREAIRTVELQYNPTHCEPHWHQAVEIMCTLENEVYTLINSRERIMLPGEICVADCYDVHSFYSYGKNVMIMIIPNDLLNDYLKVKGKKHLATPYISNPAAYKKILGFMQEFRNSTPSALLERGYIDMILGLICDECGLEDFADADISLLKNILNFLEENYHEDINLEFLAKKFGYSKYYFSRMFNMFFKFNLNEYLSRLRIQRFLSKMQANKNADIIGTAFDCGFNSWQTFYRCFKSYYGTSPKKYLNNIQ